MKEQLKKALAQIPNFEFDELTHTYTINNEVISSMTQVLDFLHYKKFLGIEWHILEYKRFIGSTVHDAIDYYLQNKNPNELFESIINEKTQDDCRNYYRAFENFIKKEKTNILFSEIPVYSHEFNIIGRLDFINLDSDGVITICDWKTSSKMYLKSQFQQLHGYALILNEMLKNIGSDLRIGRVRLIQLKKNGEYKIFEEEYQEKLIRTIFLFNKQVISQFKDEKGI